MAREPPSDDGDDESVHSGPVDPVMLLATTTAAAAPTTPPTSADWAPRHPSQIPKITDPALREAWKASYLEETEGLLDKPDVARAVPLPDGVSESELLDILTVFTVKKPSLRKKTRCVLGGSAPNLGKLDLGHGRTFSPTADATTFRLLCSVAPTLRMTIRLGDVHQAYGQARWPKGLKKALAKMFWGYDKYIDGRPHCLEIGNLYGHPLAGRHWWHTFLQWMLDHGYVQSKHDPCLFYTVRGDDRFYLLVYVDDIITFSSSDSLYREWADPFYVDFAATDFGTDLSGEYTSVNITQQPGEVTLDMERYIESIVAEMFPGGVHHAYRAPADTDLADVVYRASLAQDTTYAGTAVGKRFRSITMKCLYAATHCRPDIAVVANLFTRVQAWPSPELLQRAERMLIYLWGTKHLKLHYRAVEALHTQLQWAPRVVIEGSSDSTLSAAHSTSGWVVGIVGGGAVHAWGSKKQDSVALHTQHAEIIAGSVAACHLVSERGICAELGFTQAGPTTLKMDNTSAIDLANDPMYHSKAKHIARRDLFIRELVERGEVRPIYVKTAANVADALTKPLANPQFIAHRAMLMGL